MGKIKRKQLVVVRSYRRPNPKPNNEPTPEALLKLQTILALPELLENILRFLPLRTLLFAQRVNKHFRRTIIESPTLQQKLFLQPEPASSSTTPYADGKKSKPRVNPLIRHLATKYFWRGVKSADGSSTKCRLLHSPPKLPHIWPVPTLEEEDKGVWHLFCHIQAITAEAERPGDPARFDRVVAKSPPPAGSWRDMLFSQPPAPMIVKMMHMNDLEGLVPGWRRPSMPRYALIRDLVLDPVTVGELLMEVEERLESQRYVGWAVSEDAREERKKRPLDVEGKSTKVREQHYEGGSSLVIPLGGGMRG